MNNATDQFQNLTGKSLRLNPPKTLESVCRVIEARQSQDPSDNHDRTTRAKEIGINLLQGLKLIGGIVAQGASTVSLMTLQVWSGD